MAAAPDIPEQMQALQLTAYNTAYRLTTVPVPRPSALGPHDLLVKIATASYCHTDSMIRAGTFATRLPITPAHEGAGTVVATGPAATPFAGRRVMCGLPFHPCGACPDCKGPVESWRQYCAAAEGHCGVHRDGFLAQYAVCDARATTLLPDEIGFVSAAPLACAGRTVWRAVEQAGLQQGPGAQWLAIVGSGGGLGHLGVQFAKRQGLRVVGVDARDDGLEMTRAAGADVVVDARAGKDEVVRRVREVTGGGGADATVTLSDAADAAALGCAITKMHGTMVQVAQPDHVSIPFQELVFRDVRVKGSLVCSPEESKAMVRFVAEQRITVKTVVFDGLDKIEDLLEEVRSGKLQGKAVVVVDREQIEEEKELDVKC